MSCCHNNVEGCSCGNEPCTECPECQTDLEIGVWWRREGKLKYIVLEEEVASLKSKISEITKCQSMSDIHKIFPFAIWTT